MFEIRDGRLVLTATGLPASGTYHLAATYDGSTIRTYVNGDRQP